MFPECPGNLPNNSWRKSIYLDDPWFFKIPEPTSHRENAGKTLEKGGPLIKKPHIHLISHGYLLGISLYLLLKGSLLGG